MGKAGLQVSCKGEQGFPLCKVVTWDSLAQGAVPLSLLLLLLLLLLFSS